METIQGAGVCVHTWGSSSSSWLQPRESPCTTQTRPREGPGAAPARQNAGTASGIPAHGIIPNPLLLRTWGNTPISCGVKVFGNKASHKVTIPT